MTRYVEPTEQLVTEIFARDINRSVKFYCKLGFELLRDDEGFVELGWEGHRLFLSDELKEKMTEGIGSPQGNVRVMVRAAPTLAETRYLLDLADATPWIAGVVGWVDLEAPDAAAQIDSLSGSRHFAGIRPMIQGIDNPDWTLRGTLQQGLRELAAANRTFDALVMPRHLDNLHTFAERYPGLPIVIDHGAKPDIAGGNTRSWAADMQRLARNTDVCCKLSGLVTEAGPDWRREDILPIIEILLEAFGPRRLMWGSDWPVLLTAGSYAAWRGLSPAALSAQTDADRAGILGANAVRFYRLNAEQVA